MKSVSVHSRTMAYEEKGKGPVILLGHSYLWDSTMWRPQLDFLSSNYRVIAPDLWSHGQSNFPPEGPLTILSLAENMLRFADVLELNTFSVAGLSVGGMWGCQLALLAPERVRSLVIMNSYVGSEPENSRQKYLHMLNQVAESGEIPPEIQKAIIPLFFSLTTQSKNSSLVKDFCSRLSKFNSDQLLSIVDLGRTIFNRESLLNRLREIHIPTLIIAGEEDLSRPPHESREMGSLISESQVKVIPQAGHLSALEQPEVVNNLLGDFFSFLLKNH